ncbi:MULTISPECIES: TetR family transcriptional regulator [unclassified Aureimonas]|uniref:TetR family transcriptional regulator n=1 Tax=unclassified Aureimonas TaxID=2615206 RepID=UPI000B1398C6|nr:MULTISPECIES: TetR family transcriptional regulator [unclassified Aureimonas]
MSRRTKEEAAATRDAIIDAAEVLFDRSGVARTSLEAIAQAAKVTRGAIYWHFRDKTDLFGAMQDRARLPQRQFFESRIVDLENRNLDALHEATVEMITRFLADERARRVYTIILFRCEYVGPAGDDLLRCEADDEMRAIILQVFQRAAETGELSPRWRPQLAADAYICALVGLFSEGLRRKGEIDIVAVGEPLLAGLFAGFRART